MKKRVRLFVLPLLAIGQIAMAQTRDSLSLMNTIYYERDAYIATDEDRASLEDLVYSMRADSTLRIHIIGYGDKWGGEAINDRVSYVRAMYIGDWIRSCRVPREQIVYIGEGIDSLAVNDAAARRVEVSQVFEVPTGPTAAELEAARLAAEQEREQERARLEAERLAAERARKAAEAKRKAAEEAKRQAAEEARKAEAARLAAEADAKRFKWSNFDIRTNLFYFAGGLINAGVEYRRPDAHFGYLVNGGYSPFGGDDWAKNFGGWYVSPEVRYYIPSNDSWFVGAQFLAGGYNIKISDTGYQGSVIGGGVVGGYKIELTERFDMDFNLGVGYGSYSYDTYRHSRGVNVYKGRDLKKGFILPQAGVNLIWKIK